MRKMTYVRLPVWNNLILKENDWLILGNNFKPISPLSSLDSTPDTYAQLG